MATAPWLMASAPVPAIKPWTEATPALSLPDLDGRRVDLRELRGRVVLVNFWATWCEPCREEMPSLARLKEKLAGRPFELLFVNYGESPVRVRQYLEREKLSLPILLDRGQDAATRWKAKGLPMSFLVDARGQVRYWAFGERDWGFGEGLAKIEELIAEVLPGGR
jgi:thiol-disulfide isomerase/thioredoxin